MAHFSYIAAKKLGIKTVVIHSTEDTSALHVRMADEAICVGSPHPVHSYLNLNKILQAVKMTGAEAVHPGYGFLSESLAFNQLLIENDIQFIGPNLKAMSSLGDKIHSKVVAKEAKVTCIPGFEGQVTGLDHALTLAREIGFPVILKASAGGGGKGMRIVNHESDLASAWKLTRGEAKSSFGDERILIEKYIKNPRHIEVQVLGDKHGNVVYLPERECSIQRRNQKIIEETPSPFLDEEMRTRIGKQAAGLAQKVGYDSAGTCEFLVDPITREFYFLEMNTRLQVEHPITEYLTGLDLVEQMLLVASGKKLSFSQQDIVSGGFAIESRIYAEHPSTFLPSTGTISRLSLPRNSSRFECTASHVRVDTAVEQGTNISSHYDPLLAKVCVFDPKSRTGAVTKMKHALDELVIHGVSHNTPLLRDILEKPSFRNGQTTTDFIPSEYPSGFEGRVLSTKAKKLVVSCAGIVGSLMESRKFPVNCSRRREGEEEYFVALDKGLYTKVTVWNRPDSDTHLFQVLMDDTMMQFEEKGFERLFEKDPSNILQFNLSSPETKCILLQFSHPTPTGFTFQYEGTTYDIDVKSSDQYKAYLHLPKASPSVTLEPIHILNAPMPGTIISTQCIPGQVVQKGEEICVIEAMKMQNILRAPVSGVVESVFVTVGESVQTGSKLIQISTNAILND